MLTRHGRTGEIFEIKVLENHIVFVASAALAQELCNEKRFRKAVTGPIVEIRYSVNSSLFTAYHHEESWGVAHRIIASKLSPESVAERFDDFVTTTEELVAKMDFHRPRHSYPAVKGPQQTEL